SKPYLSPTAASPCSQPPPPHLPPRDPDPARRRHHPCSVQFYGNRQVVRRSKPYLSPTAASPCSQPPPPHLPPRDPDPARRRHHPCSGGIGAPPGEASLSSRRYAALRAGRARGSRDGAYERATSAHSGGTRPRAPGPLHPHRWPCVAARGAASWRGHWQGAERRRGQGGSCLHIQPVALQPKFLTRAAKARIQCSFTSMTQTQAGDREVISQKL
ncbi:unnamed protein product, partial [Urochloa humidicola]